MISIDFSLIIVILNFVLLMIILNNVLFKSIKKLLVERQAKIAFDVKEAKDSRLAATELVAEKKSALDKVYVDSRKIKDEARKEAQNEAQQILEAAQEEEKKRREHALELLAEEQVKALKSLESQLAGLVTDLSAKVLATKLETADDEVLIKRVISERGVQ